MSDHDRPDAGVRDLKRQCRGLGMAGKAHLTHCSLFTPKIKTKEKNKNKQFFPKLLILLLNN